MPTETEFLAVKSRINELEERLQFLYRRLKIDYRLPARLPLSHPRSSQDTLWRGNNIEAIKIYCEFTGVGHAEAKDAIDRAEQFIK